MQVCNASMVISRRQAIRHGGTHSALLRSALLQSPASSLSRELLFCRHLPLPEAVADRLSGSRYLFSAYMLQVVALLEREGTISLWYSSFPVLLSLSFIQRFRQQKILLANSSGFNWGWSYSSFDSIGLFLVLKSTGFHSVICKRKCRIVYGIFTKSCGILYAKNHCNMLAISLLSGKSSGQ